MPTDFMFKKIFYNKLDVLLEKWHAKKSFLKFIVIVIIITVRNVCE